MRPVLAASDLIGFTAGSLQFEFRHEFDAPRDVLELALMSPELGPLLGGAHDMLESVHTTEHNVSEGQFHRTWRFQAKAPMKILSSHNITRDMMLWDERYSYRLQDHSGTWHVIPRAGIDPDAPWRKHFRAEGSYHLESLENGRTRRTVQGNIMIELKVIGRVVERIAVAELRKAYEAEADALRSLCSLT